MSTRSCGSCTLCCTLQGVADLPEPKPPCVTCKLLRTGKARKKKGACSIYETRPATCQTYRCLWLDGLGDRRDRPDKLGVVFEVVGENLADPEDKEPYVVARTKGRGDAETPAARSLIQFIKERLRVVIINPDQVKGWITSIVLEEGAVCSPDPEELSLLAQAKGSFMSVSMRASLTSRGLSSQPPTESD